MATIAASVPASELKWGKNSLGNTSAAAVPYKKKSYHSTAVPMKLAKATCRMDLRCPTADRSNAVAVTRHNHRMAGPRKSASLYFLLMFLGGAKGSVLAASPRINASGSRQRYATQNQRASHDDRRTAVMFCATTQAAAVKIHETKKAVQFSRVPSPVRSLGNQTSSVYRDV